MLSPSSVHRDSTETAILFPSFGHFDEGRKTWTINVHGAVFTPRRLTIRKRLMIRLLKRWMHARPEALESPIFKERIRVFAAAVERGKQVEIRIGDRVHAIERPSCRNGHFHGAIEIDAEEFDGLAKNGRTNDGCVDFELVMSEGGDGQISGRAHLIRPTGLSVISDIDDTIKHSNVSSRRALLRNTFLRRFRPVDGMAQIYRLWAGQVDSFHYVSSSPWQLYDPLSQLLDEEGFPAGTYHLKTRFRLRDHVLRRLFVLRRRGKGVMIRSILEKFPERRFVLVGDSGEIDPEIYGAVARRHPEQITAIFIRELPRRPLTAERREKMSRSLPLELFQVFDDPDELPDRLPTEPAALSAGFA